MSIITAKKYMSITHTKRNMFSGASGRPLAPPIGRSYSSRPAELKFESMPQRKLKSPRCAEAFYNGGQAWIRTMEEQAQQIYSLSPLATWVPTLET